MCACGRLELEEGHLPECFEADERSDPTAEDVLQLVSGRTLLGSVRQRSDKLFGSGAVIIAVLSFSSSVMTKYGEAKTSQSYTHVVFAFTA